MEPLEENRPFIPKDPSVPSSALSGSSLVKGYSPVAYSEGRFNVSRAAVGGGLHQTFLILSKWRGSLWQAVWFELIIFLVLFYSIDIPYRVVFDVNQRETFENICQTIGYFVNASLVTFVLGFFVTQMYSRWRAMFAAAPGPDRFAFSVATLVIADREEDEEHVHLIRKTLIRHLNLTFALICRVVSPNVLKSYPTLNNLIEDGLLTSNEERIIKELQAEALPHKSSWWIPLGWMTKLIVHARKKRFIKSETDVQIMLNELYEIRSSMASMNDYDTVGVPIIYSQVVTFTVYAYMVINLFGRSQFLDTSKGLDGHLFDFYVPIFAILEFIVYVGWLKVALKMMHPYGEGIGDVKCDLYRSLHRHIEVSNCIIDLPDCDTEGFPPLEETTPLTGVGSLLWKRRLKQHTL